LSLAGVVLESGGVILDRFEEGGFIHAHAVVMDEQTIDTIHIIQETQCRDSRRSPTSTCPRFHPSR
jgi:hypothetical protein